MPYLSVNPTTGQRGRSFASLTPQALDAALHTAIAAQARWREADFATRAVPMRALAALLRQKRETLAQIIVAEMGKPLREARAELDKCALACEFFADHAEKFLAPESIPSDATQSYVRFDPLGVVLAIMPWNFPFWQVIRFAAPALMAGNGALLKHASNVPECALALEALFDEAGFPPHLFRALLIESNMVEAVMASGKVHAVTLTGSELAGRRVAEAAGKHLLKCVLELGGSDPFIVLPDADLDLAIDQAIASRFMNCGQSCIAAKRFIVVPEIAEAFTAQFVARIAALSVGDPLLDDTDIGPLARDDLVTQLDEQVADALARGAKPLAGCARVKREGFFYAPSLLDHVDESMRAYREELFGPVASVIRARDPEHAINIANTTPYGLGASIWTRNIDLAQVLAPRIQSGSVFVNGLVKSDPRLPFGGIKCSGYGRELSRYGIREFVNIKTVWMR